MPCKTGNGYARGVRASFRPTSIASIGLVLAVGLGSCGGSAGPPASATCPRASTLIPTLLTPVNLATGKRGTPISVGAGPQQIAITPDGKTAYVIGSNFVTPISVATDTAGRSIQVGNSVLQGIAITPDGKTVYVASTFDHSVTPITVATNVAEPPIAVSIDPDAIAITPDGSTAYVLYGGSDGSVSPINLVTHIVGAPISVGFEPGGLAITPDGTTAYLSVRGALLPIDVRTNSTGTPITAGAGDGAFAIAPDGKTAYVANPGTGTVTPITLANRTAGRAIRVGSNVGSVAIAPDGKTLYVASEGSTTTCAELATVDLVAHVVRSRVAMGANLINDMVITPDGHTAYAITGPDIQPP